MSRRIACLTIDMEPDYGDPEGHIRLLENPDFFEQYTSIINKHDAKVTMFTVTSLFERYGDKFEQLKNIIPLEYAAHSHSHDPHNGATQNEVENSASVIRSLNGNKPLGYRAPYGQITKKGLGNLINSKYDYDASVYPSFRPGKFGYSNLHMPNIPFRITSGKNSLVEFPFTSLSRVRIVFGLSFVKLLGWRAYSALWQVFGLPDIALALSHPHDFYFQDLASFHSSSMEKLALSRNAKRAFNYFDKMVEGLKHRGYDFLFMSEALSHVHAQSGLMEISLSDWG